MRSTQEKEGAQNRRRRHAPLWAVVRAMWYRLHVIASSSSTQTAPISHHTLPVYVRTSRARSYVQVSLMAEHQIGGGLPSIAGMPVRGRHEVGLVPSHGPCEFNSPLLCPMSLSTIPRRFMTVVRQLGVPHNFDAV